MLLEIGERYYVMDMGCSVIEDLVTRNIRVEDIKSIFVTHMHGDHTDGLVHFVDLCSWYYKNADPEIYLPIEVEKAKEGLGAWLRCNGITLRDMRFSEVKEGLVFDDGVLKVTAYKTMHTANSYAYLAEAEGKRVLFTGDLSPKAPEDFPISVLEEPVELIICEAAHVSPLALLPVFEGNSNIKRICFNHYSDRLLPRILEVKKALTDIKVTRAQDGTEIIL